MTHKEVGFIEEAVKAEALCGKKLMLWRDEVRDPELRRLVEECIQGSQRNADQLLQELRA